MQAVVAHAERQRGCGHKALPLTSSQEFFFGFWMICLIQVKKLLRISAKISKAFLFSSEHQP